MEKYVLINLKRPNYFLTDKEAVMTKDQSEALLFSLEQGSNIVAQLNNELGDIIFGLIEAKLIFEKVNELALKNLKAVNTLYRQLHK